MAVAAVSWELYEMFEAFLRAPAYHLALEALLFVWVLWLLLRKSTPVDGGKSKLTEKVRPVSDCFGPPRKVTAVDDCDRAAPDCEGRRPGSANRIPYSALLPKAAKRCRGFRWAGKLAASLRLLNILVGAAQKRH
ncbi:hypothetical protein V5799_008073 [Amblyomma americanum]|uniref:Uncharacterized protein n=1 Tax=Amblyomma americanum TaxID=6943 RepID=A0AAQ4FG18_AMBAM